MSNQPNYSSQNGTGIFDTARLGMIALLLMIGGGVLSLFGLPFASLANLAAIVLAIVSLVKREQPKWPAVVTLIVSCAGFILITLLILIFGIALFAVAA